MLHDRVLDCTFARCKHPDRFSIIHVRKVYFEALFLMFSLHVAHWLLCQTDEINTIFQPSIGYIYMGALVNSSTIANIYWLIQIFKYQSFGFQVHFKWIFIYNLKTKSFFFLSKCPNYIMGCITDLGSIFFLFSLFWIWHILIISCAKFEAYACSICDVMTIPINACSSLFNRLKCC